ncbi:axonemal dynein light chain domain-containing protein 1-like isoform X2 [Lineus longissimus]|uniref:axonemal dynein light chain domain-containing protein 1-like isoform X2 n=1 Tax=Lineus longissimus TaxID=88925 RepID=UPI002B4DA60E
MSTEIANPPPQNPLSKDGSPRGGGSPASLHSAHGARSQRSREKALTPYQNDENKVSLPNLKNSSIAVDKSKPLPTSLQSDFIPQDVLMSLTMPAPPAEQLGPPSRYRNLNTSSGPVKKRASNVWNYRGQREKLKHLTENTICVCGAGKDISFLYDVPQKAESKEKAAMFDQSAARLEQTQEGKEKPPLQLPDTLIPEEYHIVKNKGVMGLEYYDDEFSTQPSDHEKHLVVFPSMKPTSRFEVIQLKKTLNEMMERAGVDQILELEGARETQLHKLLELIKKEQDIYNVVFHEVIRQVTVECVERGELLSSVRERYHNLLNKVPKQVKSLHEEVMAQRALDRRLTEELMRFKNTIGVLTGELSQVKDHDLRVSSAAQDAQDDLKHALAESQKNSSLLAEYHDLYELQRNRLELQVNMLTDEKELWSTAAYSLALKVTEEHNLQTAKRLHISEKAWQKLANHFTILLSDQDTGILTKLQGHVDGWRDLSEVFNFTMKRRDETMRDALRMIKHEMEQVRIDFQKIHMGREGNILKVPDKEKVAEYYNFIKSWEEMLSEETEKFGGDIMLSMQEELTKIKHEMYGWTDAALKVFNRHRGEDGSNYPDHDAMLKMNDSVEELVKQYQVRLTGDNGVARGFIHLSNVLETWDTRLNTVLHGSNPLPDAEWTRFYQLLEDWINAIDETHACIGLAQKEEDKVDGKEHKNVEYIDAVKVTQRWVSSATNGIDSEDAKLVEQVSQLHTEMVKWMVQMLLRIAPDMEANSAEAHEMVLLGSTSVSDLQTNAKSLFERLDSFTRYVSLCCNNIVKDAMQRKVDAHEENADHEYKELQNLKSESDEWIQTAILLLHELTGEMIEFRPATSSMKVAESKTGKESMYYDHEKLSVPDTSRTRLTSDTGGDRSDMGFSDYGQTDRSGQESSQGMGGLSLQSGAGFSDVSEIPASERSRHASERSRHASEKSDIALSGGGLTPVPTGPAEELAQTPEPSEQQDVVDGPTPAIPFDSIKQASPSPSPVLPPDNPSQSQVPPGEVSQSPEPPTLEPAATSLSDVREEAEGEDADKQDEAAAAPLPEEPESEEPTNEPISPAESLERVQAIGYDRNTHFKSLEQSPDKPPSAGGFQLPESRQETPNAQRAYEALAAVETLQLQLISAEERAQSAEERCHTMEEELNKALESVRALERKLAPSVSAESVQASTSHSAKSRSDKDSATALTKSQETKTESVKSDKGPKEKRSDSQASVKSSTSKSSTKSHKKK